jgi:hypothetical protein
MKELILRHPHLRSWMRLHAQIGPPPATKKSYRTKYKNKI